MRARALLKQAAARLDAVGVEDGDFDAQMLLSRVMKRDRLLLRAENEEVP